MRISGYVLTAVLILATLTACGSGSSTTSSFATPSQIPPLAYAQSVVFQNTSTMMMCGNNSYGQLGNSNIGNSQIPITVTSPFRIKDGAVGGTHTLGIDTANKVWAWGNNGYGQLGTGTVAAPNPYQPYRPVQVFMNRTSVPHTYLNGVTAVAAGGNHSLALRSNTVWSWGANTWGQQGNDTPTGYNMTAVPVKTSANSGRDLTATAIAAGGGHSLALDDITPGLVWAWGNNASGQLGNNSTTNTPYPVPVTGLSTATGIAAGGSHSLAILADTTVVSWGYNKYGQLGNNSIVDSHVPVKVVDTGNTPLRGVVAIAAGLDHSLALKSDGTLWAWGYNAFGQLGIGTIIDSPVAVQVTSGLPLFTAIASVRLSAIGHHSLVFSGTSGWAWGYNAYGQLGINSTTDAHTPMKITGFP